MIKRKYGSWPSPITSDLIVEGTIRLGEIALDGNDLYWLEGRPEEKGRNVIVRRGADGTKTEMIPAGMNARTLVHEYGGGSFWVSEGLLFFTEYADQRIYRVEGAGAPVPITPEGAWRYADGVVDRRHGRVICVREDHSVAGRECVNTLVAVDLGGQGEVKVLVGGKDFYSTPRLSPDGKRLCWLAWNHPSMPWDGTELWVAKIAEDGSLTNATSIAGGASESIFQPEWSPAGDLYFVSDRDGWWNLYRYRGGSIESLGEREFDFGMPQWVFGMATYGIAGDGRLLCTWFEDGLSKMGLLDPEAHRLDPIETPYTEIEYVRVGVGKASFLAASPTQLPAIVQYDLQTGSFETICQSGSVEIDPGYLSIPRTIEFPTAHGLTAHGIFYAPRNAEFEGPPDERPPLLVMSHGGPTSAATTALSLSIQYWTSRGIAVLDVNYGGSTGYGRAYRERLKGTWGIVDVEDCVNGARYLADQGLVDGNRMAIRGGSAGGYTTLCALTFHDAFRAGASYYGVSDLAALEIDTHKFESRYTHSLVAPYPEREDLYRERSPIFHVERLSAPVIFFQGLEDKIVPPNQAEMMVEALRKKGLPVEYVTFEGEQHGFRQSANIKRALEDELSFYARVFGF